MCERAQDNLWSLYREYLWQPSWVIMWQICVRGPKIIYEAYIGNICESPSWVIMLEIFMWAQNSLWVYVGIFVSGLIKLRPENLYLNRIWIPHSSSQDLHFHLHFMSVQYIFFLLKKLRLQIWIILVQASYNSGDNWFYT